MLWLLHLISALSLTVSRLNRNQKIWILRNTYHLMWPIKSKKKHLMRPIKSKKTLSSVNCTKSISSATLTIRSTRKKTQRKSAVMENSMKPRICRFLKKTILIWYRLRTTILSLYLGTLRVISSASIMWDQEIKARKPSQSVCSKRRLQRKPNRLKKARTHDTRAWSSLTKLATLKACLRPFPDGAQTWTSWTRSSFIRSRPWTQTKFLEKWIHVASVSIWKRSSQEGILTSILGDQRKAMKLEDLQLYGMMILNSRHLNQ